MIEFTQKQIKKISKLDWVTDLTALSAKEVSDIQEKEERMIRVGVACGYYGLAAALYRGEKTGNIYTVHNYSNHLYKLG